jgi:UDP-glucose 4-epimerase
VAQSFEAPLDYVRGHSLGTSAVIEACRLTGIRRLVYVSSAEVYGRVGEMPVPESQPVAPRSPYAAAKVGAEALVEAAVRAGQLDCGVILRPFSVYGPGMRLASVMGRLMTQVKRGQPMRVFDARPVRDYVHVEDVAESIWRSIERAPNGITVLNICTGTGTAIADLASLIAQLMGAEPRLNEDGGDRPRAADIRELVGNRLASESAIGWKPEISLEQGLRATLAQWPARER